MCSEEATFSTFKMRVALYLSLLIFLFVTSFCFSESNSGVVRVGWIGSITGPTAKWGTYQATQIGVDHINQSGGINGKKLELIYEDTKGDPKAAVSAFKKLVHIDKVRAILGGHSSPESLAIAPEAEKEKVLMIASVTSTPKLTDAGDYIFRMTTVSTKLAELVAPYAYEKDRVRTISELYELTDYVIPVAEKFKEEFEKAGGQVVQMASFNPGETDLRSILSKMANQKLDGIYIGVQAPDTAHIIMKQLRELRFHGKIYGNEQFAGAFLSAAKDDMKRNLEGVVFAQSYCNLETDQTRKFTKIYTERFHVSALPFGCYTVEPFDAIVLLSEGFKQCGEEVSCLKNFLYNTKNYSGLSGNITFNEKGDIEREYVMKIVSEGTVRDLS